MGIKFYTPTTFEEKNSISADSKDNSKQDQMKKDTGKSSSSSSSGKSFGSSTGNSSGSSTVSSAGKDSRDNQNNNSDQNTQDNKNNQTKDEVPEICPICGEVLDENHKTNILSQEEYEEKKQEMIKNRGKLIDILNSDNESQNIGENIKTAIVREFGFADENIGYYKQAHHLISINDIFFNEEEFPNLARIAISCGYNVNSVINGIFLPSISSNYLEDWGILDCYRVMGATKMQLHKGPHSYDANVQNDTDKLSNLLNALQSFFIVSNIDYSTKVKDLVKKYVNRNEKLFTKCFLTEKDKADIKNGLEDLSTQIRTGLNRFKTDKKSCEYYVSRVASYYAFNDISGEINIIDIKNYENGQINCSKYILKLNADSNISLVTDREYSGNFDKQFLKFAADTVFFIYENKLLALTENLSPKYPASIINEKISIENLENDRNSMFPLYNKLKDTISQNSTEWGNQKNLTKKRLDNMRGGNI